MADFPNLTTVQRNVMIDVVAGRVKFTCMTNCTWAQYNVGGRNGRQIAKATMRSLANKGLIVTESTVDRMYGRERIIRPTPLGSRMADYFGWQNS